MKCPTSNNVNLVMADRQGVEIDYCPECRGVWLDRGELDKIIDRSSTQPMPQQQKHEERGSRQQAHDSQNYEWHKKKKKKNLLSELFDF
ncbi:MAG: zf-TFIIB domain-containing protein [Desulfobacula sp.]|jgi:Zn-finger nucleic acid-binding protein|nr:zf-TFIIB domain-containing protein [Desulfobacula sp.]